jgi:hypothetical protein
VTFIGESGLHFLSLSLDPTVNVGYAPACLTAADYPGLTPYNQPVTVAVGTVLVVSNLPADSEISQGW